MERGPCLGCSMRFVGCHSSCVKYKDYRQKLDVINKRRNEMTYGDADYRDFTTKCRWRWKKRTGNK